MYDLAKQSNNMKYMAIALESQGVSCVFRGSLPEAISLFEKKFRIIQSNQPAIFIIKNL